MKYELTKERYLKLRKLWFIYGNKGKFHTHGNHRFIQDLIERTQIGDNVKQQFKGDQYFFRADLSPECVQAVKELLEN